MIVSYLYLWNNGPAEYAHHLLNLEPETRWNECDLCIACNDCCWIVPGTLDCN